MAHEIVADLQAEADFAGRQSQGARPGQEDAYGVVPPSELGGGMTLLSVVADGMGGHAAGEIASEIAVQAFVDGFFGVGFADDASRLWGGLEAANREIGVRIDSDPALKGMGTTLVGLLIRDGLARWISVGDSPLYLLRDGELKCLNRLHLAFTEAEPVSKSKGKGQTSALAAAVIGERLFDVDDPEPLALVAGDLLFVASDGINTLSEEELVETLLRIPGAAASECAKSLIEAVERRRAPRQDNTTVVVVRWGQPVS